MARKVFADCHFGTERNRRGLYVGVCEEFPDVRTAPRKSKLQALDDVMSEVSERLRYLDQSIDAVGKEGAPE